MKLYTSSGVNPLATLGGCFPLLIQLPVFIALYDVLLHSIDLRESSRRSASITRAGAA